MMKLQYILFFVVIIQLLGCSDYHTITSPNGTECLTLESIENLNTKANDIYLYYGKQPVNKKEYIKLKWSSIFGITVYWGTKPLIIRSVVSIKENTISPKVIDMKTYNEDNERKIDTMRYISYDFVDIVNGKYDR